MFKQTTLIICYSHLKVQNFCNIDAIRLVYNLCKAFSFQKIKLQLQNPGSGQIWWFSQNPPRGQFRFGLLQDFSLKEQIIIRKKYGLVFLEPVPVGWSGRMRVCVCGGGGGGGGGGQRRHSITGNERTHIKTKSAIFVSLASPLVSNGPLVQKLLSYKLGK